MNFVKLTIAHMAQPPQPNMQNMVQAIQGVADNYQQLADEMARMPTVPVFYQGDQMQYLQGLRNERVHGQQRLGRTLETVRHGVARIERRLERVEQRMDRVLGRVKDGQ
ncbi:Protein of unknown function [Pyronema omphalodes CBS 100304]|uniref:Uncharacterized protein n=1 Tax=Pyronema omphalodes (strain CBS 100304) TaxID=1076935 RepID=U4LI98_PYROM|nr:Protein of unknown function [Pyronema omphalodes CBS 100304]